MGDLCIVHNAVPFTRNEMEWDKLIMENKGGGQYQQFSYFWQSWLRPADKG